VWHRKEGIANSSPRTETLPGILGAAVILLCVALIPVMLVRIPPLVDYPNHMARMHILADEGRSPWLRQYYEIHWSILPNLSMDLVVPPLTRFMSLETAGQVFIGLTFALLAGGVMALHAALHRRRSPWPLLVFFFLYNSVFLWGFLNYLFGLGLALLVCALWMTLRDHSAALVVPLFSLAATVLFFAHLFAFGIFAMVVLTYEFVQWWRHRREPVRVIAIPWWKALPTVVVPLVLLILAPTFRANPDHYPLWLRGSPPPPAVSFLPLNTKLEALKGTIRTEHQLLDRATGLMLIGLVGIGLALRRCSVLPSMYLPLGVVALAAVAMPSTIGTTAVVDIRMPIAFVLLAIASSDWPVISRCWFLPLGLILSTLFLARMAVITNHWRETDRHYSQFVQTLDQLPEGTRLLSAIKLSSYDATAPWESRIPELMPMSNLSCWGIIRRSVFISTLFSAPGQQPIQLTTPVRSMLTMEEFLVQAAPIPWDRIGTQYDYVVIRRSQRLKPPVPANFTPFGSGDAFQFYRTDRQGRSE
jgi:hypothetical protein